MKKKKKKKKKKITKLTKADLIDNANDNELARINEEIYWAILNKTL